MFVYTLYLVSLLQNSNEAIACIHSNYFDITVSFTFSYQSKCAKIAGLLCKKYVTLSLLKAIKVQKNRLTME